MNKSWKKLPRNRVSIPGSPFFSSYPALSYRPNAMSICINLIEYAPYIYICCPYCDEKENKYLIWFEETILTILDKVLISGVTVCGRIFSPAAEFFWLNWPRSPGRAWQQWSSGQWLSIQYTIQLKRVLQNGGSVLLVNVVENWDAFLASPRPWQSPDCIPIVGAVLSL